jgi:hypothetical protein
MNVWIKPVIYGLLAGTLVGMIFGGSLMAAIAPRFCIPQWRTVSDREKTEAAVQNVIKLLPGQWILPSPPGGMGRTKLGTPLKPGKMPEFESSRRFLIEHPDCCRIRQVSDAHPWVTGKEFGSQFIAVEVDVPMRVAFPNGDEETAQVRAHVPVDACGHVRPLYWLENLGS